MSDAVSDSGGGDRALDVLQTVFGYPSFRGHQAEIVQHIAQGGDPRCGAMAWAS